MTVSHAAEDAVLGGERTSDGLWTHRGKLVVRSSLELLAPVQPAGASASLVLPAGSVGTVMLAANAVQQLLGSYTQLASYTLPAGGAWNETPAQVNVTCTGVLVRIEFNFAVSCPAKGQRVAWGVMLDGAPPLVVLGGMDAPEASYGVAASGTYYYTPLAGPHRFAIGLNGPSGAALVSSIATTLFVTEQRR